MTVLMVATFNLEQMPGPPMAWVNKYHIWGSWILHRLRWLQTGCVHPAPPSSGQTLFHLHPQLERQTGVTHLHINICITCPIPFKYFFCIT